MKPLAAGGGDRVIAAPGGRIVPQEIVAARALGGFGVRRLPRYARAPDSRLRGQVESVNSAAARSTRLARSGANRVKSGLPRAVIAGYGLGGQSMLA